MCKSPFHHLTSVILGSSGPRWVAVWVKPPVDTSVIWLLRVALVKVLLQRFLYSDILPETWRAVTTRLGRMSSRTSSCKNS